MTAHPDLRDEYREELDEHRAAGKATDGTQTTPAGWQTGEPLGGMISGNVAACLGARRAVLRQPRQEGASKTAEWSAS